MLVSKEAGVAFANRLEFGDGEGHTSDLDTLPNKQTGEIPACSSASSNPGVFAVRGATNTEYHPGSPGRRVNGIDGRGHGRVRATMPVLVTGQEAPPRSCGHEARNEAR